MGTFPLPNDRPPQHVHYLPRDTPAVATDTHPRLGSDSDPLAPPGLRPALDPTVSAENTRRASVHHERVHARHHPHPD